jgi:hypothetical protein
VCVLVKKVNSRGAHHILSESDIELWWLYFDLELRYTATIRDRQKSLELKPACLLVKLNSSNFTSCLNVEFLGSKGRCKLSFETSSTHVRSKLAVVTKHHLYCHPGSTRHECFHSS